jgi:hypothetical protein
MLSALLYLRLTSGRNWLLSRIRRLREPKYLAGAIAGMAYFWFFFLRHLVGTSTARRSLASAGPLPADLQQLPLLFIMVPLGLIAVIRIVAAWVAPDRRPGLAFTEPEVAFLFPAPMTRRMLVNFKLLSSQFTILLSSVFFSLISNRGATLGGNMLTHAFGWWLILSTLSLHTTAAAFTVARLIDGGVSRVQRQTAVIGLIVLVLGLIGYTAWHSAPPMSPAEAANPWGLLHYAIRLGNAGLVRWLIWPIRILLAPFFAATGRDFLLTLGPALALLALHYIWVLRAETSFEESSIAFAEKRSRLIEAIQSGKSLSQARGLSQGALKARRGPFPLRSAGGRPEIAFLWKNLLSTSGFFRPRTFSIAVVVIVVGSGWLRHGNATVQAALGPLGIFCLIFAAYALVLGPQFARQDLRSDLAHADILKTYPLRGWQVVLGELLTPAAILTALFWLLLLLALLLTNSLPPRAQIAAPELRWTIGVCLAVVLPLVCLLQLMVPNAATLLFPSWARSGRSRDRGIDVMGQRLIFVAGQILVILCALLPVAIVGLLVWFAAHWFASAAVSTAITTIAVLVMLGLEACLGLWWLGHRFEVFDLSSEAVK